MQPIVYRVRFISLSLDLLTAAGISLCDLKRKRKMTNFNQLSLVNVQYPSSGESVVAMKIERISSTHNRNN